MDELLLFVLLANNFELSIIFHLSLGALILSSVLFDLTLCSYTLHAIRMGIVVTFCSQMYTLLLFKEYSPYKYYNIEYPITPLQLTYSLFLDIMDITDSQFQLNTPFPDINFKEDTVANIDSEQQQLLEWAARLEVECLSLIELNQRAKSLPSDDKITAQVNNMCEQLNVLQTSIEKASDQLQSVKQQLDISDKLTTSLFDKVCGLERRLLDIEALLEKPNSRFSSFDMDRTFPWQRLSAVCETASAASTHDIKEFLLVLVPRVIEVERANRAIATGQEDVCRHLHSLTIALNKVMEHLHIQKPYRNQSRQTECNEGFYPDECVVPTARRLL